MKQILLSAAAFFLIINVSLTAQIDQHIWKPLVVEENQKLWYDANMLDSAKGDKFQVWVLELHKPPLEIENIDGDVYRSKTLYTVNLNSVKYGILKIVYYDVASREIFNYDYSKPEEYDDLNYPYPITENSFMFLILKELMKQKGEQSQK
jgi:hypothetical protein